MLEIRGRIIPEKWRIEIEPFELTYDDPMHHKTFRVEVTANKSHFSACIECISNDDHAAIQLAVARVVEVVKAKVDMVGFLNGVFFHVIVDEFTVGDRSEEVALSERRALENLEFPIQDNEIDFCERLILNDVNLRLAMTDLVASLGTLNYSAIAAARVLDFIRGNFAPEKSEKAQWREMQVRLRVSERVLKYVTNASRKPRHGVRGEIDGSEQVVITQICWSVMGRYLALQYLGELPYDRFAPLSESTFSIANQ